MRVELTHIVITGFKGYKDKVEYDLGYRTVVTGDNGLGKSSIGEAIVWALTGCDINGNEKAATRLINDRKPKVTEIILDFKLDDEPQTIIRRKRGSSNEVYWNEAKVTTNDIARDIFKSKDVFLSIFNPFYFPELTPKEAKQLLSDVLKPIASTEIFAELGDYLSKVLNDNGFRLADTFLQDARADLKEQEDNIIYLQGVNDGLKPMEIQEKKIFTQEKELNEAKAELEKLNSTTDINALIKALPKPKDYSGELSELRVEEMQVKSSMNNISLQELLPVEIKKAQKDELLKQYKDKKHKLDNMVAKIVKCENCGNEIDLTKEAKEILQADINDIKIKGCHLKDEIKADEAKNAQITETNNKIKSNKEAEVKAALDKIEAKRRLIFAKEASDKCDYEDKIQEIKSLHEASQEDTREKIEYLENKISTLETERKQIFEFNATVDAAVQHNEKLGKDREINEENIKNSQNKIEQLKVAIDAAKQYNSIKLKKQSEQIKPYLDKVEIKFEKLTKDGELKDDFKVLYEGKEFNKLSDAQKIKASLEISNLLINLLNLHFPIFVDRAESINVIPDIDTQMIQARVTTDSEVKVEVLNNEE